LGVVEVGFLVVSSRRVNASLSKGRLDGETVGASILGGNDLLIIVMLIVGPQDILK
jgi:hypothetical protein